MMAKSGGTAKTRRRATDQREERQVRFAGQRRRDRRGLLATTALQAGAVMMLYFPLGLQALAQPAPTSRPQGGAVVAGHATIGQTTAQTTVAQSSQRAAIDWTTYNIGAAHTVVYEQPNASSLTVNRVTAPDPSQIAGRIRANGQIVIVNRSGVVFMNGSQVNAQSLVVSSADISNRNVMAGRMVFDQPGKPGATISNAGTITVKETGLAALVAPHVANSGTITARMGHVVLAGAEAHTVDLYGDGLMSVDVTRQVRRGSNGSTALVTNSGTIAADGGTIVLTAQAADGIVTNLVTNTGRLRANTVGDHSGTIVVSAVGGSISVEGPVQAQGRAPGSVGGTVVLAATDTVAIGAGARISTSGQAGGGTVAIGTTAARARAQGGGVPVGSARVATVAAGARISADAKVSGNGGSVAILSTDSTAMAGAISARGGRQGGNGGNVEVSGDKGFSLTGRVDVGAAKGLAGTILIDPTDLTITNGAAGGNFPAGGQVNFGDATPSTITDGTLNAFTGANVILQATNNITVSGTATVTLQAGLALTLQAGNSLTVSAGTSLAAPQGLTLSAGSSAAPAPVPAGSLTVSGAVSSTNGIVRLTADGASGAVGIGANVTGASVQLVGLGGISQTAGIITATTASTGSVSFTAGTGSVAQTGGTVSAAVVTATAGSFSLAQANAVGSLGLISTTSGLAFTNGNKALTVTGPVSAGTGGSGNAGITTTAALVVSGNVSAPSVGLSGSSISQTAGTITASAAAGTVTLTSGGAISQAGGTIAAPNLTYSASGAVNLPTGNSVGTLGSGSSTAVTFNNSGTLTVAGPVTASTGDAGITTSGALTVSGNVASTAGNVTLQGSSITQTAGAIQATSGGATVILASIGAISQTGGTVLATTLTGSLPAASVSLPQANVVGTLGTFTATGAFTFANGSTALTVTGPIVAGTGPTGDASITTTGALTVSGSITGQNVTLAGSVIGQGAGTITASNAATGTITLNGGGAYTETGGTLSAAVLSGTLASLSAPGANAVAAVSALSVTGGIALNTTGALSINNTVSAGTGDAVFVSGAGITVNGTLSSTSRAVALTGTSVNLVAGSSVTAGTQFDASVGATAASVNGGGNIGLAGTLSAPIVRLGVAEGIAGSDGLKSTSLVVAGPFSVGANTLDLESTGAITQSGGTITAGTLTGNGGSVVLGNTSITKLAGFATTAGTFSLTDSHALTVTGSVVATGGDASISTAGALVVSGGISGGNVSLSGGSISQTAGVVTATMATTGTVTLTTAMAGAGAIAQTGGVINGAVLTAPTTASSVLLAQSNGVGTVNTLQATGTLSFVASGALTVAGPVMAGSGTLGITAGARLTLTGTVSGPSVSLSGTNITQTAGTVTATTAGTGTVTLTTAGAVAQSGGGLVSGAVLTGTAASMSLAQGNLVGTLGSLSTTGALTFNDVQGLTVAGPVSSGTGGGVGNLGITASGAMTLTGALSGPNIGLSAASIMQTAGSVTTAPAGTLTFTSAGAVAQTGGTVTASVVTGTVSSLSLPTAANTVTTLGPFNATAAGTVGVLLNDTGPLIVSGTVQSAGNVVLAPTGALTVAGTLGSSAGGIYLTTIDAGGITVNGTLSAPTAGGAGVVSLSANNLVVANTASVTAGTRLDLAGINGTALVINGGAGSNLTFGPATLSTPTVRVGQAALTSDGVTIADGVKASNITFAGNFNIGAAILDLETTGTVTFTTGATVTAGGASGSSAGNATINFTATPVALGPFEAGGDLVVTAPGTLTVTGYAVAGNGDRLSLTANTLITSGGSTIGTGTATGGMFTPGISAASRIELNADTMTISPTTTVNALGGTIAVAPRTPRDLVIETAQVGTELALTPTAAALLVTQTGTLPGTLVLGTTSAMPTILGAIATNITISAGVNLSATAANLGLYTPGNIIGTAGLVVGNAALGFAGTLTGGAGGAVALNAFAGGVPLNSFDVLNNFSAGGGLGVSEIATATAGRNGLLVLGTVSSGTGGLSLSSVGSVQGGMRVGGGITIGQGAATLLDATGQTLTLTARDGAAGSASITQAALATINAATLTGSASSVDGSASAYDVLLNTTRANINVGTLGNFIVGTGAGNAVSAQGAFRLVDASPLAITGQVTAKSISISANSVSVTGLLGACLVSGAGGDLNLAATAGSLVVAGGTVAGQSSVGLSASGGVSVSAGLVDSGAGAVGGTITSTSGLALSGGSVFAGTVNGTGGVTMTGGLLHATALNVGTVTYSDGDIYGGNAVALSVPLAALAATDKAGSGTLLTLTTAGSYTSNGFLYSGGSIGLTVAGDFGQARGTFAAAGNVTVSATGAVNQAAAGTIDAGGTVLLRGFGAPAAGTGASVLGTISGQTVQVIEPGYALTAAPVALPGSFPITVGALVNTYHCPGCDALTAASTYPATFTAAAVARPVALRLDAATLSMGTLSADAVELHSLGATTQTGALVTSSLTGTAGYAGLAATLPVYSPGAAQARLAPGDAGYVAPGYVVAAAPVGATVALTNAGNNIQSINGYQVAGDATSRGGLTLVDQPGSQVGSTGTVASSGLVLTGVVRAGPSTDPLDATAEAASGGGILIQTTGATGGLAVNGTLGGNAVSLAVSGAITEAVVSGVIVASTLTGSGVGGANAVTLGGANQVATLNALTAPAGNIAFVNRRDLVVVGTVSASSGNIGITAQPGMGTTSLKEGAGTGNLTIVAPPMGSAATVTALGNVSLQGTNLVVNNGLIGAATAGSASTGNLGLTATTGAVSITGGTIGGQASVFVNAPGGIAVSGGLVNGPSIQIGNSLLTLSGGSIIGNSVTVTGGVRQSGGVLHGTALAAGTVDFSGGDLYSGGNLLVLGEPSITGRIVAGGTLGLSGGTIVSVADLYSGGNLAITTSGSFQQSLGTIAAGTGGSGASLAVTAGSLVTQAAPGTLEASGAVTLTGSGAGAASILGRLAGTSISVNEPSSALTFAPALFAGGTDHPLGNSASVVIGPVSTSFVCPGCTTTGVGGPFTVNASVTQLTTRPGTLALGGGTLLLGTAGYTSVIAANTMTLTSVGATTQVGGSLEAAVLSGSAGYAGAIPGAQARVGGGYTAAAAGNGATVTLGSAANNITQVAGYQIRGDDASRAGLTLVDAPSAAGGLVVTGVVRAGPSSDPLDGSAAAATGNNVSITVNGANGGLTIGAVGTTGTALGGRVVTLTTTGGGMAEAGDGRIVAGTLTGSASGGITLAAASAGTADGGNQVATLGSLAAMGGALALQDSRNLAVTGPVTASGALALTVQSGRGTASVAEGQSAGNLAVTGSVAGGANTTLMAYGTLTGGTVTAPGTVTLLAGGDVNVGDVTATTLTGTAGGLFTAGGAFANATTTSAVAGTMTLTDSAAVTLGGVSRSQGALLVTAPSITSTGQLATPATIQLHATGGGFTQTAGIVAAGTSLIVSGATDTAALSGGLVQQAGLLASGGTVRLLATGDAMQAAAGTVAAPVVLVVSLNGANTFGASQAATVSVPAASVTLSGVLPVFSVANPAGTVALVSQPGSVRLDGATVTLSRQVQGDTVELHAAGNLTEAPGGVIQANVLTGTAGYASSALDAAGLPTYATLNGALPGQGTATLAATGNNILRLGNFQARTGLILVDAPANQTLTTGAAPATGLTIGGTVRAGVATDPLTAAAATASGTALAITLTGTASNLIIGDGGAPGAVLAGGIVTVSTPGAVTETAGGLLVASTLTGAASTVALTATGGNQVAQLGQLTTVGNFTLVNSPNLVVTGAVTAGPATPVGTTPVLTLVGGGSIDINGGSLTAGTVSISSGGAFSETNGFIATNALTIASSNAAAGSTGNQVTTIGAVTSPGGFSFTDKGSLVVAGPVSAANGAVSFNVGGSITAQGNVAAGGAVTLMAGSTTTQNATSTITGASLISVSAGATSLGGMVSTSGPITVTANGIAITGGLSSSADAIGLNALTGSLSSSGTLMAATSITGVSGQATTLSGTTTAGTSIGLTVGTGLTFAAGGSTTSNTGLAATAGGVATVDGGITSGGAITIAGTGVSVTGTITGVGNAIILNAGSGSYVLGSVGALNGGTISTISGGTSTLSGTETAGGALLASANGLTLNNGVSAGAITLQAGPGALMQSAASVVTGSSVTATSGGTTTLAGTVTASGPASFTANGIGVTGSVTSKGDAVTLAAGGGVLTQAGTVSAGTSFTGSSGQGMTFSGRTSAGGTVNLTAGTDLSLTAGSTTTAGATLAATAGGTATLAGTETVTGDVNVTASGIGVSGSIVSIGGQVGLRATNGALTQAGTLSAAGVLTESATGSVTLSGVQTAGGAMTVSAGGDLSLVAASSTTARTTLQATAGGNATLAGTETVAGDVSVMASGVGVSGSLSSTGGQVGLTATNGALTQAGKLNAAGALTESATGSATLSGSQTAGGSVTVMANGITIGGATVANGGSLSLDAGGAVLSLTGTGTLRAAGAITERAAAGLTTDAGTVTAAGTSLTATVTGGATLAGIETAGGAISLTAGNVSIGGGSSTTAASSLSITSGGDVMLAGAETASSGTITVKANGGSLTQSGSLTAGTSVIESAANGATLTGFVSTPLLTVTAPSITLGSQSMGALTLKVGGTPQAKGAKVTELPEAGKATSGAFFEAGTSFTANNPAISPFVAGGTSTVRIDLTSGRGTIVLNTLNSRSTDLILDLGGGSGTGNNIAVRNLDVRYTGMGFGSGSLKLNNVEVAGQFGTAAAGAALVFPQPSREYQINSCAVASVNCIVLRPQAVPIGNPLKELSLSFFRDQDDDRDLLVPNISDQGL